MLMPSDPGVFRGPHKKLGAYRITGQFFLRSAALSAAIIAGMAVQSQQSSAPAENRYHKSACASLPSVVCASVQRDL